MHDDEPEVHWFKVINNSDATQKYIMFAPPPTPDFDTPIWQASDDIGNETSWEVHTTAPIFAGVGTQDGTQITVKDSGWEDSGITNGGPGKVFKLSFDGNGDPGLEDLGIVNDAGNTFSVSIEDLPDNGKTYVIVFGKRDGPKSDIIAPCASITAKPNTHQPVTPIIQLYFYNDSGTAGGLIDYDSLKDKAAHIDFAVHTPDASLCTVIHKTSSWETAYDNTLPNQE
ncbi:uncharacterized protein BO80DRAFT_412340 [Aspergillus ibericus CBS 121593]|uniref:Uncharacterized protein n=1 Tax=Aspergillus ibericus CBS 121593 TaxID=1448316 RepID=A0A395GTG2_9EURO|nr:hypothetical protein BO80DRAFT_412340 [Aspergillus ibericus CBS 121593]RAK98474.1 hypothetical protein BO80DRAFT_412340 [Aspergillus ibericus CBS 121593]